MKKPTALLLLSFFCTLCVGQESSYTKKQDSIIYVFPENVEKLLWKELQTRRDQDKGKEAYVFLSLHHKGKDTLHLSLSYELVSQADTSGGCYYYSSLTNRYAVIGTEFFPLIFWDDYVWGTTNPTQLGTMGNRDRVVQRTIYLDEGAYGVIFTTRGKIVGEDYGYAIKATPAERLSRRDGLRKKR